jgi:hypothetical protein
VSFPDKRQLTLYKRWTLRPGVTDQDVRRVVEQQIMPAYAALSREVELGLELDIDGHSILAIQRWRTIDARASATMGAEYADWWMDYEVVLGEWDRLVEFVAEWSTITIELNPGP